MSVKDIFDAVVAFDQAGVPARVESEISAGTPVEEILNQGLISPMEEVGERFSDGDLFVPEMLMAAQAMKAGLAVLKPHLASGNVQSRGTVVIGTVKGDLHDIGKNLVAMMLEGGGFDVVDLGVDVESDRFVQAVQENNAQVVALSALLTTTMSNMETTVNAIKDKGIHAKTIVGGAPVTKDFADRIGADGYSPDAPSAVLLAKDLVKEVLGA